MTGNLIHSVWYTVLCYKIMIFVLLLPMTNKLTFKKTILITLIHPKKNRSVVSLHYSIV